MHGSNAIHHCGCTPPDQCGCPLTNTYQRLCATTLRHLRNASDAEQAGDHQLATIHRLEAEDELAHNLGGAATSTDRLLDHTLNTIHHRRTA